MYKTFRIATGGLAFVALAASTTAFADNDSNYCMDLVIEPFHMVPDGSCAVRDYWYGELQEKFYPFTQEEHLFNCEFFGTTTPLKIGDLPIQVPSSVVSEETISGTIGGYPFEASLLCASLTNWYQDSCVDPDDAASCTFQLAQPFLSKGLPFPRVTEVSIFDGVISVGKGKQLREVPVVLATRAAGIMHLEDLTTDPPEVGASVTHSLLGMATYDADEDGDDYKVLEGTADLLLQGHIFSPMPVEEDPGAARIRGSICSKDLYKRLNRKGGGKSGKVHDDD